MAAPGGKQQQCHHILVLVDGNALPDHRSRCPDRCWVPPQGKRHDLGNPDRSWCVGNSWQELAKTVMAMDNSSHDAREETAIGLARQRAQNAVMALDARLCDNVRQPLMSETLTILAKHNRETAMRLMCPSAPLTEGAKVCVEAWGTVCRTTPDGEAFILLDSESHRGLILAPKDTELRPMAHETLSEESLGEMRSKAQAIMEAARLLGSNNSAGTQPDSSGEFSQNQEPGARVPRVVSGATAAVRKGVIHAQEGEVERGERGPAAAPKRRKLSKYSLRS